MPDVIVRSTGERAYVSREELAAHPDAYEVTGAQLVTTDAGDIYARSPEAVAPTPDRPATAAEEQQVQREVALEATYGDAGERAFGQGVASTLSIGLSDLGEKLFRRGYEEHAEIAEAKPGHRLAGEITGGVVSSVAGAEALAGRAAAGLAGRLAPGAGKTIAQAALASGAEGALAGIGQTVAQAALKDRELSAEAIVGGGLKGLALGAPLGAAVAGTGVGMERAVARIRAGAGTADDLAAVAAAGTRGRPTLSMRDVVPLEQRSREALTEHAGRLTREIDGQASRARALRRDVKGLSAELSDEDAGRLAVAHREYADAVTAVRKQFRAVSRGVAAGKAPPLADVEEVSASALRRVERAAVNLEDQIQGAERQLGVVRPSYTSRSGTAPGAGPAAPASFDDWVANAATRVDAAAPAPRGIAQPATQPGTGAGIRGIASKAGDVLGLAEAGQELGLPIPDVGSVPVAGPLLELYARYRAARLAVGRIGLIKATGVTRAAAAANETGSRITQIALDAAAGTGRALQRPVARKILTAPATPAATRVLAAQEDARDPDAVAARVEANMAGFPVDVVDAAVGVAQRRASYLTEIAPKAPFAGTPFADESHQPSERELADWARVERSLNDPASVFQAAAAGVSDAASWEAVRTVYPKLLADFQRQIFERQKAVIENLHVDGRLALGDLLGIPLHPSQLPDYRRAVAAVTLAPPEPPPQSAAPHPQSSLRTPLVTREERPIDG